jgi:3-oxoacyl-[acyl-carrier-protein] synthase II
MEWLRDGVCRSVLAGASESSKSEMVLRSFERLGVLSAAGRTRPFDAERDGFVVGEGCAVFRIEPLRSAQETAQKSGARILGQILSVAMGADAHHLTTPDPSGATLAETIARALVQAGTTPDQVGWIHAHGTATAYNDPVEISALKKVFGKALPPVTATKGATGHLLGASGAVALAITVEALRGHVIPHIAGLKNAAPEFEGIDFVMHCPRKSAAKIALVLNHGFGGHLAAAVVSS